MKHLQTYNLFENEKNSVPRPKIGSMINVYHPHRGGVQMEVIDIHGNTISCEYDGIEYTVRLNKIDNGLRWEAQEL
jgi:hypothetical protein